MLTNLQAFRFIFAVFIFVSHLNYVIPEEATFWNGIYHYIFKEGYVGVTFFFMLSGYILAYRYTDAVRNSRFSYKKFLYRRIARLLPVYYVSLLIALPLTFPEFISGDRIFYLKKLITNVGLVQSYIPISDYYFSFNGVSWSISTELFFYLCFPFILTSAIRHINSLPLVIFLIIATIFSLCILFFYLPNAYYWLYISPFTRLADFSIGILAYLICRKYKLFYFLKEDSKRELVAIIIALLFLLIQPFIHANFKLSIFYWFPMFVILSVFGNSNGRITVFLAHPIWQYLGSLSFSFYLIHHTLFKYYANWFAFSTTEFATGLVIFILFMVSLLCSHIIFRFIEEPARIYLRNKSI